VKEVLDQPALGALVPPRRPAELAQALCAALQRSYDPTSIAGGAGRGPGRTAPPRWIALYGWPWGDHRPSPAQAHAFSRPWRGPARLFAAASGFFAAAAQPQPSFAQPHPSCAGQGGHTTSPPTPAQLPGLGRDPALGPHPTWGPGGTSPGPWAGQNPPFAISTEGSVQAWPGLRRGPPSVLRPDHALCRGLPGRAHGHAGLLRRGLHEPDADLHPPPRQTCSSAPPCSSAAWRWRRAGRSRTPSASPPPAVRPWVGVLSLRGWLGTQLPGFPVIWIVAGLYLAFRLTMNHHAAEADPPSPPGPAARAESDDNQEASAP